MKIGDFKKLNHYVNVGCDYCTFFDVYMIDIDEDRIELSDNCGMVIGSIGTKRLNDCEIFYGDEIIDLKDL